MNQPADQRSSLHSRRADGEGQGIPNPIGDLQNPETEVRRRKYHLFGHIFWGSQKLPRNLALQKIGMIFMVPRIGRFLLHGQ